MLTNESLREYLRYDQLTGEFTWLKDRRSSKVKGTIAGYKEKHGYIIIRVNSKNYKAHRLAWLYVYGNWPKGQIDHINGIKNDNRIINLRDVNSRLNMQNKPIHRTKRLVGTTFNKQHNSWKAQVHFNGKKIHLGYFNTEKEAHIKYMEFVNELN